MPDKRCPWCGLWSTGSALLCDCGYNFEKGINEMVHEEESSRIKPIGIVIIVLFFITFEYMMVSPLIRARIEAPKLYESGVTMEARVFYPGHQTNLSYFLVDLYNISYRFVVDDPDGGQKKTFTDSQFVSGNTLDRLNESDYVTINYLPQDPTISRLAGTDTDNSDLSDFPLLSMLCLIPIFIGWLGWMWEKGKFGK